MAFTTANASTLATHLNVSAAEATTLITLVRAQPLGAIIGSTPAMMDTPSLDPPPDDDYGRADATGRSPEITPTAARSFSWAPTTA